MLTGCLRLKAFNTAVAKYRLLLNGTPILERTDNICDVATKLPAAVKSVMKSFNAPESCPVKETKICAQNQSIDISKLKGVIGYAKGKIEAEMEVESDTGKSCYKIAFELVK